MKSLELVNKGPRLNPNQGQGIGFRNVGEILFVAYNSIYVATLMPYRPACPNPYFNSLTLELYNSRGRELK